jgi:hypothetical protein
MSFLNRSSLIGKMVMGLCCVAALALLVAVARPFEPASSTLADAGSADGQVAVAGR